MTRNVNIAGRPIGDGERCFIIAEAGSNHNGSLEHAKRLIDVAVEAGADAVRVALDTALLDLKPVVTVATVFVEPVRACLVDLVHVQIAVVVVVRQQNAGGGGGVGEAKAGSYVGEGAIPLINVNAVRVLPVRHE